MNDRKFGCYAYSAILGFVGLAAAVTWLVNKDKVSGRILSENGDLVLIS